MVKFSLIYVFAVESYSEVTFCGEILNFVKQVIKLQNKQVVSLTKTLTISKIVNWTNSVINQGTSTTWFKPIAYWSYQQVLGYASNFLTFLDLFLET